jgi:hypothetical protein
MQWPGHLGQQEYTAQDGQKLPPLHPSFVKRQQAHELIQ